MMISRRHFLTSATAAAGAFGASGFRAFGAPSAGLSREQAAEWLQRWEQAILAEEQNRYCDREMGEGLGWLVSPLLNGWYQGYLATRESRWVEHFVDWTDACLRRAVREPDGYFGWPKGDGNGGESEAFAADSLLGEAMLLRPVVLMAAAIQRHPVLMGRWVAQSLRFIEVSERNFAKWDARGCWREVKDGGLWVVPPFGIDSRTGDWSSGYADRAVSGFSHPANKQNHIARWLLAMYDVTGKSIYRDRAEKWFRLMRSRIRVREGGASLVWNYWDPAGPWDYQSDGTPRHWVGVHPNGGYYAIDVEGMVTAYEHGLVFHRKALNRLIATQRDFMWNQKFHGAKFSRIDGGETDPRWAESPGVLWTSLIPYDEKLRTIFFLNHQPDSWGGLVTTPWSLARFRS